MNGMIDYFYSYKKLVTASLFALLFLLGATQVRASHIVGADLTYRCVNSATSEYEVCLTVYRDAVNGVQAFDPSITVFIFRTSTGSLYTTEVVNLPPGIADTLAADWTACTTVVPNIRIEYKKYTFNVILPPTPGGYDIAWARCCRNNAITNIATNQGISIVSHVPGTEIPGCNSSPTFNQVLPIFLCQGQPFFFDHSATDADGDSLVYQVSPPLGGFNFGGLGVSQFNPTVSVPANPMGAPPYVPLTFLGGFSFADPFGSGNFNIDQNSGLLSLTPSTTGISVFAVSVLEYRNGVLISENKRDFQIQVISCAAQGPAPTPSKDLSGITVGGAGNPNTGVTGNGILDIVNDTIFVLPTASFCYGVDMSDINVTDSLELFPVSAAFGIGGTAPPPFATLSYTGANPVTGGVCWQVPCENEGDTISLIVGGRDIDDCPGYNFVFDTTYVVVAETNPPNLVHTSPAPTVDTLFVDANRPFCYNISATDVDTFDVLQYFPVEGPFLGLGGTAPFASINSTGNNPLLGDVCWTPTCEQAGQSFRFIIGVEDANFCFNQDFDTLIVVVNPLPNTGAAGPLNVCAGDSAVIVAFGGNSYSWTPTSTLSDPTSPNPFAFPTANTTYNVEITDSLGCVQLDSVSLAVFAPPPVDAGKDTIICQGGNVQLGASGALTFQWEIVPGLNIFDVPNPIASNDSNFVFVVTGTDGNGCTATDSVEVAVMYAIGGPDEIVCAGDSVQLSASGGTIYNWLNTNNIINGNTATPTVFPAVTTNYRVEVEDANGCRDTAFVLVTARPLPTISFGTDTAHCPGDSLQISASGGQTYSWLPSPSLINPNDSAPIVFPLIPTYYTVTVTDSIGCSNTDSLLVSQYALPPAFAGNDTVRCGDTPLQLTASGGVQYFWQNIPSVLGVSTQSPIITPDSNATYNVQVIDTNGCANLDSVDVRFWEADAGPDQQICPGDSIQLAATNGLSYLWDVDPNLINNNLANATVFPPVTQEFGITITDISGCTDRDTVLVNVLPLPPVNATSNSPIICTGDTAQLNVTGGITYAWTPAALMNDSTLADPIIFPIYSGINPDSTINFIVEIEDANGCSNRDTVRQQVGRLPVISLTQDTFRCPGDSVRLDATGGGTYAWTPDSSLSSNNTATTLAFPDTTTNYQVVVTAPWGCVDSSQVQVRVNQVSVGSDQLICPGDTTNIEAFGGIAYTWTPIVGLDSPNLQNPRAFPLVTTVYTVAITDSNGCTHFDSLLVNVRPRPTIDAGNDTSFCQGGSVQLQASGGLNYEWLTTDSISNSSIPNPIVNPTLATVYVVEGTDALGCTNTDSVLVSINLPPNADAGPDTQTKCGQDSVQLNASGGISYLWSPNVAINNLNIPNPRVLPDSNQVYVVQVTDTNGCVNTDSILVQAMYASAFGSTTICEGDTTLLEATTIGGLGASYSWEPAGLLVDPNVQNAMAFPTVDTDFIVTVTDTSGCTDTDTLTISVIPTPTIGAEMDTSICQFDTVQLTASGGLTYLWFSTGGIDDPSSATPNVFPTQTAYYYLQGFDAAGCKAVDSVLITVFPAPPVDAGPDLTKCGPDSVQLNATGALSYEWTPAPALSALNIPNPMAAPLTTTDYIVRGADAIGCYNFDTVRVNTFYADAGEDRSICPGEVGTLVGNSSGGQAIAYSWEPANLVLEPNRRVTLFSVSTATNFILTATDSSGCTHSDTVLISVFEAANANAGQDTAICRGDSVQLSGLGGATYLWTPLRGLDDNTLQNPITSPNQTTLYTLTVTSVDGCLDTDSVEVIVNQLPLIQTTNDTVICRGEPIPLFATGADLYVWSPDSSLSDPTSDMPIAFPSQTTTYSVLGQTLAGCEREASVTVQVEEVPQLNGNLTDSICLGNSTTLVVDGSQEYLWSTGSSVNQIVVAPSATTTYWVVPRNNNGCSGDTLFIEVYVEDQIPIAEFTPDVTEGFIPLDVTFNNTSRGANTYTWNFGDGNGSDEASPTHSYLSAGEFTVSLTADNGFGCPDQISYSFINVRGANVIMPTSFTPNNDGVNDEFSLTAYSFQTVNFQVFSRWGLLVYEANDPAFKWDGTYRNRPLDEGVYVYKFTGMTFENEEYTRTGTITLIR
ncbi:MAG: gliding motility-associated C-terminal domain-containing protein [Bacteroidota bacterium]